jgi:hypothetical protein
MKVLRNLIIDAIMFFGFLIVFEEKITGESLHEWLGLAGFVTMLFHILLHWKWVADKVKKFFKKMTLANRINFIVDFLFLVAIVGVSLSGVLISKTVLPALGITLPHSSVWKEPHSLFADASLYLLAIHFGLHWTWIVAAFKNYILCPIGRLFKRTRKLEPAPVRVKNDWQR